MTQPRVNEEKYINAMLYFFKYCNNQYLGITKLSKLFYYLDFISYRDKECLVTEDIYVHKQYGPVPENIDVILAELNQDEVIEVEMIPYKDGTTFRYKALKGPNLSVFNTYEKQLLEKISKEFYSWSTDKIVAQTHLEAPWFYSEPYDKVDYNYAKDIDFFLNRF